MPDDRQHRDRPGLNELFQTFDEFPDIDGDGFMAGTRVPIPRKPNLDDAAIALPEPDAEEHDLLVMIPLRQLQ